METEVAVASAVEFPCKNCGAMLQYAPGTNSLTCSHCGVANPITASKMLVHEEDYLGVQQTSREDRHEEALALPTGFYRIWRPGF